MTLILAFGVMLPVHSGEAVDVRVTATVIGNCKILSTQDISFGTLDPGQAVDTKSEGMLSFACTRGIDYKFTVDNGSHYDDEASRRRMKGISSDYLPYSLDNTSISGLGQGFSNPISFNLQASVKGSDYRDLPASSYNDTIRVLLEP